MKSQKGFTLVEVLVAVALLSIIGVGLVSALGGATKVLLKADTRETARDLAQAQMESVQNQAYDNITNPSGIYDIIPNLATLYPGYDVEIHSIRIDKDDPPDTSDDDGLQEITIMVNQGTNTIFTLVGMKVNR